MKLSDLTPGAKIEYLAQHNARGNRKVGYYKRKGVIKQATAKFITVQRDKYPETIQLTDITSGLIKITNIGGQPLKRDQRDPEQVIAQAVKLHAKGLKATEIAEQLGVPSGWLAQRLDKAIVDNGKELYKESRKQIREGEDNMPSGKKTVRPSNEAIWAFAIRENFQRLPERMTKEFHMAYKTAVQLLKEVGIGWPITDETKEFIKQQAPAPTPNPDPDASTQTGEGYTEEDNNPIPYQPTEPEPANDSIDAEQGEVKEEAQGEYTGLTPVNKAIWETSVNAQYKVHQVCNDLVALALMKELVAGGVV